MDHRLAPLLLIATAAACDRLPTATTTVTSGPATALAAGFEETPWVILDFDEPTAMEFAPDGRLFVADQQGRLRVIKNGALLPTPFVTVSADPTIERGLLGVAFAPGDPTHVFVYYTATATGRNRVSRFTVSPVDPDVADPGSEVVLLDGMSGTSGFHNGGAIHFGTDGRLYIAVGDDHVPLNAQDPTLLAGKMLRINADGSIPSDNPFVGTPGVRPEIWALGLRNPFTFSVQPGSGTIYINDVGEGAWEEIDRGRAGANYGWPACEGPCALPNFDQPIYAYDHSTGCSITGGTFYQGALFGGGFVGSYVFSDYCAQWLHAKLPDGTIQDLGTAGNAAVVDLKQGPDGALYYLSRIGHNVVRVSPIGSTNHAPVARITASPVMGAAPLVVSANASLSTDADGDALTFGWDWGDGGTATGVAASHSYGSAGSFTLRLTVQDARGATASTSVPIQVGLLPAATISTPLSGTLYRAGQTISFSGSGVSGAGGALAASSLSWTVLLHHDTHTHPFLGPLNGVTSGTFTIPNVGETSPNVFYRIYLTATDPTGIQRTVTRDVRPIRATIDLATVPSGLGLTLDGQPLVAPATISGVVGMRRIIAAPVQQVVNGRTYQYVGWSDGLGALHTITTPDGGATYTATYADVTGAGSGPGDVVVTTATTGTTPDPDGYVIVGDGSVLQPIAPNASFRFTGVSAGSHTAQLTGVASNCVVVGANPRTVTVAGGVTTVTFAVDCSGGGAVPNLRISGSGAFGLVALDVDVMSTLVGTLRVTENNFIRADGTPATATTSPGLDPSTGITGFTRTSNACVRITARTRIDTGELADATIDVCDNTPTGGPDSFAVTVPSLGYQSSGSIGIGGFVLQDVP